MSLAVLACAGPPAGLLAPVPLEAYGAAGDDALCAWAVRCRHVPDDATCRRLLDPKNADPRDALDAVAAGRLAYDPAQAARCLRESLEQPCTALPFAGDECAAVFTGLVGEGEPCAADAECAGDAPCQDRVCETACCVGLCGPPAEPLPPVAAVGEPCATHTDCVPTAYCEIERVCVEIPDQPGERCLFGCAWGDLFCDLDSETCRRFGAPGEECGPELPCDPAWSFCDGVCRPRPGPGDACDDSDRRCVPTTFCDAAVCVPRRAPGEPCEVDSQ